MLQRTWFLLLVVWGVIGSQRDTALPCQTPDASLADSLADKIQILRARYEQDIAGAVEVVVSEEEANAYLFYRLAGELPEGVIEPWIRFTEGPVWAGAILDLAALKSRIPPSSLTQLLSGRVPVELAARLHAEDGVGKLDLESVTLGGVPLPKAFMQELVTAYTKSPSRPDGIRLEEPFELPYGIESVQTKKGQVLLRQGGASKPPISARPRGKQRKDTLLPPTIVSR